MAQDFTVDRDSTKRVLGSAGTLVSYGTDEPAFEFNTDGSYKGLLVEPAATNICKQSEDITTTWQFSDATRTADATTAPDGNTTADELTATSSGPRIYQGISVSAVKYTASVFLKGNGLDFARITMLNGSGFQFYGLSGSGTVGGSGGGTVDDATIQAYPNGWYRCTLTWTQASATTVTFLINGTQSISSATVNPTGSPSIYIWGAQLEAGAIATSYIPTTTANVIRAADDISLASASSLIGQTEGTLYVELDYKYIASTSQWFFSVQGGSSYIEILQDQGSNQFRMIVVSNGQTVSYQGTTCVGLSGIQKLALVYDSAGTGLAKLFLNGSAVSTDTSVDLSSLQTLSNVFMGIRFNNSGVANQHIRAAALFSTRLSDSECEELTTV